MKLEIASANSNHLRDGTVTALSAQIVSVCLKHRKIVGSTQGERTQATDIFVSRTWNHRLSDTVKPWPLDCPAQGMACLAEVVTRYE